MMNNSETKIEDSKQASIIKTYRLYAEKKKLQLRYTNYKHKHH